jgi:hypothetical protein
MYYDEQRVGGMSERRKLDDATAPTETDRERTPKEEEEERDSRCQGSSWLSVCCSPFVKAQRERETETSPH